MIVKFLISIVLKRFKFGLILFRVLLVQYLKRPKPSFKFFNHDFNFDNLSHLDIVNPNYTNGLRDLSIFFSQY